MLFVIKLILWVWKLVFNSKFISILFLIISRNNNLNKISLKFPKVKVGCNIPSIKFRVLKLQKTQLNWRKVIPNALFSFYLKGTSDFLPRLGVGVVLIFCLAKSRAHSWTFEMSGLVFCFCFILFFGLWRHVVILLYLMYKPLQLIRRGEMSECVFWPVNLWIV